MASNTTIFFKTGATSLASTGTEVARMDSDGLKFNGDTLAANALDDYEEGTFTPVFRLGGATTGMTQTSVGTYTKIGRMVHVQIEVRLTVKGPSTGTVTITGLPFSASMGSVDWTGATAGNWSNWSGLNSPPNAYIANSSSQLNLNQLNNSAGSGTSDPALDDTNVSNTTLVGFNITYPAAT